MSNEIPASTHNPLINSFCGFCIYVRGRTGMTPPYTGTAWRGDTPIHNNKNTNIIYIKGLGGASVPREGIV